MQLVVALSEELGECEVGELLSHVIYSEMMKG
jgi:hypothetical protein